MRGTVVRALRGYVGCSSLRFGVTHIAVLSFLALSLQVEGTQLIASRLVLALDIAVAFAIA